jgi:hypothetical protein
MRSVPVMKDELSEAARSYLVDVEIRVKGKRLFSSLDHF